MAIKVTVNLTKEQLEQLDRMKDRIAFKLDEYILSRITEIKAELHMTEIDGIPACERAYLLYHNLLQIQQEAEED
jgi:hypothetical protein